MKRRRQNGAEVAAALANRNQALGSCDADGDGSSCDQQGAAEDGRAAQRRAGSLKVTIQQSSDSREFGPADRDAAALRCHVCRLTCRSLQLFQQHLSGPAHLRKLRDVTQSIQLRARPLLDRGRRWCDTCQNHFTGDVIVHRRTEQHKACKRGGRPFCPACQKRFRTPRKFVEHMKSAEHKEQVLREDDREAELITVDAVGCFQEEGEELEVGVEDEDEDSEWSEVPGSKTVEAEESQEEEFDPELTYGSDFVVPVRGFVCRLCRKFFYGETAARHAHCGTRTHFLNLQNHRAHQRRSKEEQREGGSDPT